ncbi:hypothetical protein CGMCC3_g3330 [Colletotrichum fructicola]|uniref:Uncharacterized protein n=1 Tax=Colletotrichum fructicola (strain Nara gc5) TaxID=1213859 RepID=L2FMW5_COLFN|nr:uncharacterized protein CGMCC3_g3330 [Colletotrichum fructicola]KAE9580527.1 hypothetical protein CGMCC3_g3330 [Colletotrichum fructicola]
MDAIIKIGVLVDLPDVPSLLISVLGSVADTVKWVRKLVAGRDQHRVRMPPPFRRFAGKDLSASRNKIYDQAVLVAEATCQLDLLPCDNPESVVGVPGYSTLANFINHSRPTVVREQLTLSSVALSEMLSPWWECKARVVSQPQIRCKSRKRYSQNFDAQ